MPLTVADHDHATHWPRIGIVMQKLQTVHTWQAITPEVAAGLRSDILSITPHSGTDQNLVRLDQLTPGSRKIIQCLVRGPVSEKILDMYGCTVSGRLRIFMTVYRRGLYEHIDRHRDPDAFSMILHLDSNGGTVYTNSQTTIHSQPGLCSIHSMVVEHKSLPPPTEDEARVVVVAFMGAKEHAVISDAGTVRLAWRTLKQTEDCDSVPDASVAKQLIHALDKGTVVGLKYQSNQWYALRSDDTSGQYQQLTEKQLFGAMTTEERAWFEGPSGWGTRCRNAEGQGVHIAAGCAVHIGSAPCESHAACVVAPPVTNASRWCGAHAVARLFPTVDVDFLRSLSDSAGWICMAALVDGARRVGVQLSKCKPPLSGGSPPNMLADLLGRSGGKYIIQRVGTGNGNWHHMVALDLDQHVLHDPGLASPVPLICGDVAHNLALMHNIGVSGVHMARHATIIERRGRKRAHHP